MTDRIYRVRDPTGELREVTAPEDATDEQIISRAKQTKPHTSAKETVVSSPKEPKTFLQQLMPEMVTGEFGEAVEKLGYRAGGAVTDAATKVLPPEGAAAAGYAANVAAQTLPMMVGGFGGKAVEPVGQAAGRSLMQSALKPSAKNLLNGKAARAIDTMLKEGINVSEGGLVKLQRQIAGLSDEVAQVIAVSPATVDKNAAATSLQLALNKFSKQVNPSSDLKAIESAWTEFLSHPLLAGQAKMPVQLAQELKQGTHKVLGNKAYGELKGAEIEAQKLLAKGLRQEIEKAVPEVAKLNAKESELLNAKLMTEIRVLGEKNKDPGGMVWLAHHPSTAMAWLASRSALIKSLLARGAYGGPITTGRIAGAAYGANVLGAEE